LVNSVLVTRTALFHVFEEDLFCIAGC